MHFYSRILILTALVWCAAASARAVTLTVDAAVSRAVRQNPALSAAHFRIDEARGRLLDAGRLSNPEVEFEFMQNPRAPERSFGLAWMQKFPVTARLRLAKAVSRAELAAAEAEVRNAERKLAGEVRAAAVKILVLDRLRGLRGEQIVNSEELTAFTTRRLESGEASAVDVAQAELEARQLAIQVIQTQVEQTSLLGELRLLLGLNAREPLSITGNLPDPGAVPSGRVNVEGRADFQSALSMYEAAERSVALARANKWEDVGVGLMAEHERAEDAPEGFERDTMLGFRVSLPLPIWNKNEGKITEAAAAAQRAKKEIDAVAAEIRSEVAVARNEMEAIGRIIAEIDSKLIPQSREIEKQLRSAYQLGQTTLPEVIRARGRRFELEAQRLDALRDYHLARARHQTAIGSAPRKTQSTFK